MLFQHPKMLKKVMDLLINNLKLQKGGLFLDKLYINDVEFDKNNVLILGKDNDKNKFIEDIFCKELLEDKEAFFFDESFNGIEYFPKEPKLGGLVKVRSNIIDGLKTYLISIVMGKRRGVTIIVNSSINTLIENECIDLLRELVNEDSGCNLIICCDGLHTLNDFNFDGYIELI